MQGLLLLEDLFRVTDQSFICLVISKQFLASVLATTFNPSEGEEGEGEILEDGEEEDENENEEDLENQDDEEQDEIQDVSSIDKRNGEPKSITKEKQKLPSKGAALKALAEGNSNLIAQRVAAERLRSENKSSKHHGKKHNSAKGGRFHAGGKAKSDEVRNNMAF